MRGDTTSATGSGAGSASGSASGTGLSLEDTKTATTDDPEVLEGVTRYKAYVEGQVDELIAATTVFTNAVRAGRPRRRPGRPTPRAARRGSASSPSPA